MNGPPPTERTKSDQTLLILWCVVASLAAVIFALMAVFSFTRSQKSSADQTQATTELAFATVPESIIPGRYKWIESGRQIGTVILHPDYSITNWRGERKPGYRWTVQPEALLLEWLQGFNLFTRVIGPGVYEGWREGKLVRLERESTAQAQDDLPPAPAGYSWQPLQEINANALKPKDWFFKHAKTEDADAFFLTQEDIDQDGFFTTGLTLNYIRDLRRKTGKSPSAYARALVEEAASTHHLLENASTNQGTFQIVRFRFASKRPDGKDITAQNILLANDGSNSLYLLVFEAPASQWAEAWKIGETLLSQLRLDEKF